MELADRLTCVLHGDFLVGLKAGPEGFYGPAYGGCGWVPVIGCRDRAEADLRAGQWMHLW